MAHFLEILVRTMTNSKILKPLAGILILSIWVILLNKTSVSLEALRQQQIRLIEYYHQFPVSTLVCFFIAYVFSAALSLPLATILTVASGAIFGFWTGLVLVSTASTVGATLAFWLSRFLLRDWVQERFPTLLQRVNEGIRKDGLYYLFGLRISPIFPFFLVNLIMGLTPISSRNYFWMSLLGMLPGTALYVNVGTQIAKLQSFNDVLSPVFILSLSLFGLFPILARTVFRK